MSSWKLNFALLDFWFDCPEAVRVLGGLERPDLLVGFNKSWSYLIAAYYDDFLLTGASTYHIRLFQASG